MTFFRWSKIAATNATADPTCQWPEGMPPSQVNDSARGNMAASAKYRDDVAGAIATGGTSTAFTVSSNQGFTTLAYLDGQMVAFTPHTTSGGTATLNVDALGAKPLRQAPNVELPSGALIQGTPYVATYYNSSSEFILHGFAGTSYGIPLGAFMPYSGATAPNSAFVLPYGQAISRSTYATLFTLVSTTFGVGDGTTTFNLPDLRGRVVAGKDDMGGASANRLTGLSGGLNGDTLGATGGEEAHTLITAELPVITPTGTVTGNLTNQIASFVTDGGTGGSGIRPSVLSTVTLGSIATFNGASFGSGGAHNIVQPTIILPYIMRVI